MALPDVPPRPRWIERAAACCGFALAVLLLRCFPLRGTFAVAGAIKRIMRRSATRSQAEAAIAARDWIARYFPGRAACLEMSLSAFLVNALHGRAVDWCVGCRFTPCESHAWIEIDDHPVGESAIFDKPFIATIRI